MGLVFSNTLEIKDKFTSTLNSFKNATKDSFSFFAKSQKEVNDTTKKAKKTLEEYRKDVMKLANEYKKAGMSMSEAMKKAYKEIDKSLYDTKKTTEKAKSSFSDMFNNTGADKFIGKLSKVAGGIIAIETAKKTLTKGIESASEFQNASVFLGAVYGEQKGKEKYQWATNEANKTPFEEDEVASGLARAHSLGLKDDEQTFKMYEDLGSFAKIQGVGDLSSAIDAISDAQGGEFERLQTITGMKREALEDFAKEKGLGKFTNKKGQVTDKDKLMEVIKAYMDDKGITGMTDKFANTFSGRMSTLKGNFKKSFAELMGIAEDGTIKKGSLFENISKSLEKIIDSVNRFSKSKGAEKLGSFLGKIGDYVSKFIDYCSENPEKVGSMLKTLGTGLLLFKTFSIGKGAVDNVKGIIEAFGGLKSKTSGLPSNINGVSSSLGGLSKSIIGFGAAAMATRSFFKEDGVVHKVANAIYPGNWFTDKKIDVPGTSKALLKHVGNGWNYYYNSLMGREDAKEVFLNERDRINLESDNADRKLRGMSPILTDDQKDQWYGYNYNYATIENSSKKADYAKSNVSEPTINFNVEKIEKTADVDEIMREATKQYVKFCQTTQALR